MLQVILTMGLSCSHLLYLKRKSHQFRMGITLNNAQDLLAVATIKLSEIARTFSEFQTCFNALASPHRT